jgi:Rieske Fe-S protein
MATVHQSRRRFLGSLIALAGGVWMLGSYLRPRLNRNARRILISKDQIPANGALVYREDRMAVIREAEGMYALSLVCTHLGCTVNVSADELFCPCHGSRFTRQGAVLQGPADRPLERYVVEDQGDRIAVILPDSLHGRS